MTTFLLNFQNYNELNRLGIQTNDSIPSTNKYFKDSTTICINKSKENEKRTSHWLTAIARQNATFMTARDSRGKDTTFQRTTN